MTSEQTHDSLTPLEILNKTESEAVRVRAGLEFCDESPWEWGNYIERRDGDVWYPLVYGGRETFEETYRHWLRDVQLATSYPGRYRNPRIVRRAVSPWEERTEL